MYCLPHMVIWGWNEMIFTLWIILIFFFLIPVSENDCCCLVAKLYLTLCNPWTTAHQLPCLLLSPKVCSNSSPLYRWENHYFCLSRFLLGWPKYLFRFFFFFFFSRRSSQMNFLANLICQIPKCIVKTNTLNI